MKPPYPSPTPTWHNDVYPSISSSRPELSATGKTIIITGAGSGIGQQTALTFASAGASKLILLGRNESKLSHTRSLVLESSPSITFCEAFSVNVSDEKSMREIALKVGTWDILILGAGFLSKPASIKDTPVDEWWESFETNVTGAIIAANVFLPTTHTSTSAGAVILAITTVATVLPPAIANLSSYACSKRALEKVMEFLSLENPNVFCASVHPGSINTYMFTKSESDANRIPMDSVQLPAHFLLWMSSPEAKFLNGRTVWANWDVDELKAKAKEIEGGRLLTVGMNGWPFPNGL